MNRKDGSISHLQAGEDWLEFQLRVQPRASSNQLCGWVEGVLKLRVKAPPVEGKANKAAMEFLAGILKVPKKQLEILSGKTSRNKRVRIWGIRPQELLLRIQELLCEQGRDSRGARPEGRQEEPPGS